MGKANANGVNRSSDNVESLKKMKKVIDKRNQKKRHEKGLKTKAWKGVTCPVCLEVPHNSVVLLCSSFHKGCRTCMCDTGSRLSNCLEHYKKASAKEEKGDKPAELLCPLCRGHVKGWTVVEDERKYFNSKKRDCMEDNCSFFGSYKQLRKHVKAVHPRAKPRAVDPETEEKWKKFEGERERSDVISTVMSTTPGALVFGDYVIEPYNNGYDDYLAPNGDEYFDLDSLGALNVSRVQPRSGLAVSSWGLRSILMRNRLMRSRGRNRRRQSSI